MAEELKVEPDHLDSAATRLAKVSGDNSYTGTYLKQWLDPPRSEGGLVLSGVDVARGDVAASRQLTDTLKLLAEHTTDPALKDQIDAVLSGKAGVREFACGEVFSQTLDRVMPAALDEYSAMSEEERRQLAEQGEAQLDRYRDSSAVSQPQAFATTPEPVHPAATAPPTEEPGRTAHRLR